MGNRIYYAIQQLGIGKDNGDDTTVIHGLQSLRLNTGFNDEPVISWGNLAIDSLLENSYEISLEISKVLDGFTPIYLLATSGVTGITLQERAMSRCSLSMSTFDDSLTSATGIPLSVLQCTGLYVSSLSYVFDANSNFGETVGFVGNHKKWGGTFNGQFDNTGYPTGVGGVNRRENLIFGATGYNTTILPTEIHSGEHLSNITISANIGREIIPSWGEKTPFYCPPIFPIETTTEISVIATSGYNIGTPTGYCSGFDGNFSQSIRVATCEGTCIDMGTGNKLVGIGYGGGDAGGGNVRTTYTYKGYNDLTVTH